MKRHTIRHFTTARNTAVLRRRVNCGSNIPRPEQHQPQPSVVVYRYQQRQSGMKGEACLVSARIAAFGHLRGGRGVLLEQANR